MWRELLDVSHLHRNQPPQPFSNALPNLPLRNLFIVLDPAEAQSGGRFVAVENSELRRIKRKYDNALFPLCAFASPIPKHLDKGLALHYKPVQYDKRLEAIHFVTESGQHSYRGEKI